MSSDAPPVMVAERNSLLGSQRFPFTNRWGEASLQSLAPRALDHQAESFRFTRARARRRQEPRERFI